MALKFKIDKAGYDALPDVVKAEYKADGSDYVLNVEGGEDTGALKRAKDHEAQLRRDAEDRERRTRAEMDELRNETARRTGDTSALEQSWKEKVEAAKAEGKTALEKLQNGVRELLVGAQSDALAGEISTVPTLMKGYVQKQLDVDFSDLGAPKLRVLDAAGKPTSKTVDDLKKELVENKELAAIVKASNSSGGGAAGQTGRGGAGKTFKDMTESERLALHRENPQEFRRLNEEHRAAQQKA
jgi:hypothetical protein